MPSLGFRVRGHNAAETLNQTSLTFKNALQQLGLALGSIHVITEQLCPSNLTFQHLNQWLARNIQILLNINFMFFPVST
jgi:hypothetical protein